jgi:hypothetical protein
MHVVRAKAPTGFAKGQYGTLDVQAEPFDLWFFVFFFLAFHLQINSSFQCFTCIQQAANSCQVVN